MTQQLNDAPRTGRDTWIAEVFVGGFPEPHDRWEVPGVHARGLVVSYVVRMLRARLAEIGGAAEVVDGELVFVSDGSPVGLRGQIRLGAYQDGKWVAGDTEATATIGPDGEVSWDG
jgi:hypothetical protein